MMLTVGQRRSADHAVALRVGVKLRYGADKRTVVTKAKKPSRHGDEQLLTLWEGLRNGYDLF